MAPCIPPITVKESQGFGLNTREGPQSMSTMSAATTMSSEQTMSNPHTLSPKEVFIFLLVDVLKSLDPIPNSVLGDTKEEVKERCRAAYKEYRTQIKAHESVVREKIEEIIQKDVFIDGLHQRFEDQATDAAYFESALKEANARISEVEMNYNAMKNAYHRLAAQYVPQLRPIIIKKERDTDCVPAVVVRPVTKSMKKRRREWECLSQYSI